MKTQHLSYRDASGFSLVEMMIGTAMIGAIALGSGYLLTQAGTNLRRFRLRNQLQSESQACMDTIARLLHNGSPNTVAIRTVGTGGVGTGLTVPTAPPNDSIAFNGPDGTLYHIYWTGVVATLSALPKNYVVMTVQPPGQPARAPVILATHVTSVMFSADSRNLTSVNVSLRLDASLDGSGRSDRIVTYEIPNRTVVLTGNLKAT